MSDTKEKLTPKQKLKKVFDKGRELGQKGMIRNLIKEMIPESKQDDMWNCWLNANNIRRKSMINSLLYLYKLIRN